MATVFVFCSLLHLKQKEGDRIHYYSFRKPRDIDAFDLKDQWWRHMLFDKTVYYFDIWFSYCSIGISVWGESLSLYFQF